MDNMSSAALSHWQPAMSRAIAPWHWPTVKGLPMPPALTNPGDHLADNVKALRTARGLSQQQIAKAAGVPRATWTHLESGAANPTLAVLIKIASALQVRLDELLAAPSPSARHILASE